MNDKLKFCPMLVGKQEVKALTIGAGDCVIPTFQICLQEHCAAFVEKYDGEKWCNHYHTQVEYFESEE